MLWREAFTRYVRILAVCPLAIMFLVSLLSIASILVATLNHPLPDFSEPQAGFETRGTDISSRIIAWENLIDSVSHLGPLTSNPLEWRRFASLKQRRKKSKKSTTKRRSSVTHSPRKTLQRTRRAEDSVLSRLIDHKYIGWLCGDPLADYARVVFESSRNQSLFSRESIISMCSLDTRFLRSGQGFSDICETKGPAHCCPGWSLGIYVALISNKTSCYTLADEDIKSTFSILRNCSKYYHSGELVPDCHLSSLRPCNQIPPYCTQFNAVYHILHFLVDKNFLSSEGNTDLQHAISFLPVARSSITLDYFRPIIERMPITDGVTRIVAMELGLKESLFNEYMIEDGVYLILGGCLIFLCVLSYTVSLFITISTLLTIVFSLGTAYFVYTFILEIEFFPFMNALAVVIALGVGSDDTFIMVKSWNLHKEQDLEERIRLTLSSSALSIFVTSLTTSGAFLVSYVSNITAIKCFSLFASIAILCNFFLMLSWTPACLSFHSKYLTCSRLCKSPSSSGEESTKRRWNLFSFMASTKDWTQVFMEKILPYFVIRPRLFWILGFGTLGISSLFIVLYSPGLKLPDKEQFHLFPKKHPFERYDSEFRSKFGFEISASRESSLKLPLTFVWGVRPTDNGNHLDPGSKGSLELDPYFDMTAPASQRWLLQFCVQLRRQSFYSSPSFGPPLLSNCFIETFKSWMERRCEDAITKENRYPCCQKSKFPFEKSIFQKCILQSIENLYSTPRDFWIPSMAGPKFNISTNQVSAVIIEYESNSLFSFSHEEMFKFYESVNNWFTKEMLVSAPPELKRGFFMSHLGFFDVQNSLSEGTLSSVFMATGISAVVLLISTQNPVLALFCALNVANVIFGTLALLVLLGWKLNVLESVAVTLTVGLSADFALHYGVSYIASGSKRDREIRVIQSLSNMAGPVSMAAITTICSGVTLLPTRVLPYIQIGTFIIVVMSVSWTYSTFFLQSLIRTYGTKSKLNCSCFKSFFEDFFDNSSDVVLMPNRPPNQREPPKEINLVTSQSFPPIIEPPTQQPILTVAYVKSEDLNKPKPISKRKKNHVHLDGTATLPSPRSSFKAKPPSQKSSEDISKSLTKLCTAALVHSEVTPAEGGKRKGKKQSPPTLSKRAKDKLSSRLKKLNRRSSRRRTRYGSLPLSFLSPAASFEDIPLGTNGLPRPVSFSHLLKDDGDIESETERRRRIANSERQLSPRELARLLLQRHRHAIESSSASKEEAMPHEEPLKQDISKEETEEDEEEKGSSGPSWNFFRRHPSTSTIIYTDDSYDPKPILPNKTPDTPDIWIPRTVLKA